MTSTGGEPTLIYYIGTPKRIVKRKIIFLSKSCGVGGDFLYWDAARPTLIGSEAEGLGPT